MFETATTPADVAAARLAPVAAELVEIRRMKAALDAREARALAAAGQIADEWAAAEETRSDAELARRSVAAELAAALRVSDRTVQRQVCDAERMLHAFPATVASLSAGRISLAHARVIVEAGDRIEHPELIADYEDSVLPYAEAESASRLRPVAKRRAEWYLDETFRERHAHAAAIRSIRVDDLDDGMAELNVTGSAVLLHGVHDRLTQMARDVADAETQAIREAREQVKLQARKRRDATASEAPAAEEDLDRARAHLDDLVANRRSLDAVRVDILTDMLLTAAPEAHTGTTDAGLGSIRATVRVTVPVLALLGSPVDDPFDPITLAGHGPIDPETARDLARTAPGWDRILTHPISGAVLGVDRYQPTKEMRRTLEVRDQHCRFPGCRQSVSRCDLDHTIDWQFGGTTVVSNLGHLCRRHHTLKHHTPWAVIQKPDGSLEWTSPGGRVYTDRPSSSVHFATDAEFDPEPAVPAPF